MSQAGIFTSRSLDNAFRAESSVQRAPAQPCSSPEATAFGLLRCSAAGSPRNYTLTKRLLGGSLVFNLLPTLQGMSLLRSILEEAPDHGLNRVGKCASS